MEDYLHIQKPDLGYRYESGPGAWEVLDYEPFMDINRHLIATDELTLHRSAAIIRRTGSAPVGWHTDWCGYSTEIKHSGDVPNRGLWPSGKWFYLTGSRRRNHPFESHCVSESRCSTISSCSAKSY